MSRFARMLNVHGNLPGGGGRRHPYRKSLSRRVAHHDNTGLGSVPTIRPVQIYNPGGPLALTIGAGFVYDTPGVTESTISNTTLALRAIGREADGGKEILLHEILAATALPFSFTLTDPTSIIQATFALATPSANRQLGFFVITADWEIDNALSTGYSDQEIEQLFSLCDIQSGPCPQWFGGGTGV